MLANSQPGAGSAGTDIPAMVFVDLLAMVGLLTTSAGSFPRAQPPALDRLNGQVHPLTAKKRFSLATEKSVLD